MGNKVVVSSGGFRQSVDLKNLCQNRVPGEFHTTAINFI